MQPAKYHETVSVHLPSSCVHGLLALSNLMDGNVIEALQRAISGGSDECSNTLNERPTSETATSIVCQKQHMAEILGQQVVGRTLPELFGKCVDLVHDLEPSSVERLSDVKTSARHYVARRREDVHFKSQHLVECTIRTGSGWWISTNISRPQMITALRLLTEAAGLSFGRDVVFPLPS